MNEFTIYKNMKRWLLTYGTPLLDLLFPVVVDSDDPLVRYGADIVDELDKHFNLLSFYQMQVKPELPVILVSFKDLTGNSCFPKWRVIFDVYFQTIAPEDCKDDLYQIDNRPEAILEWQEMIEIALCMMIHNMDDDLRQTSFDGEPWQYPINYDVIHDDYDYTPLEGIPSDELLHFAVAFDISDNISTC